jgi:hypothetical protein
VGQGALVVLHDDTGLTEAAHRLVHLFLQARMPRAPLWMHEAFASYFQNVRYAKDDKGTITCFGYLAGGGKLVPLAELLALPWADYDGSGKAGWYRNTAQIFLDYLYNAENGKYRSAIPIMLGRIAVGGSTEQAWAAALPGVTVDEMNQRMVDFHKDAEMHPRPQCPMSVAIAPGGEADLGEPQVEKVNPEDIKQLAMRLRLLPHRTGYVDWYPPEVSTIMPPPPIAHPAAAASEEGAAP